MMEVERITTMNKDMYIKAEKEYNKLMDYICAEHSRTDQESYFFGTIGDFVNECQYWISCYHESGHLRCIEECDSTIEKAMLKDEELRLVKFVKKYERFI